MQGIIAGQLLLHSLLIIRSVDYIAVELLDLSLLNLSAKEISRAGVRENGKLGNLAYCGTTIIIVHVHMCMNAFVVCLSLKCTHSMDLQYNRV